MGLEKFVVKTPEMDHKIGGFMILAYSLTRILMQKFSSAIVVSNSQLSFKGILDVITSSQSCYMMLRVRSKTLQMSWSIQWRDQCNKDALYATFS